MASKYIFKGLDGAGYPREVITHGLPPSTTNTTFMVDIFADAGGNLYKLKVAAFNIKMLLLDLS
jgi:hypothetical protein